MLNETVELLREPAMINVIISFIFMTGYDSIVYMYIFFIHSHSDSPFSPLSEDQ